MRQRSDRAVCLSMPHSMPAADINEAERRLCAAFKGLLDVLESPSVADWEDDDYDPRQPSHRALSHLLELIVYQVETYLAGGGPKGGEPPPTFDPCAPLTTRKIDKWYKSRLDARSGAKK